MKRSKHAIKSRPGPKLIATILCADPNEWYVIEKRADSVKAGARVSKWRSGTRVAAFRPTNVGRFEFRLESRGYGTGQTRVLGRFLLHAAPLSN